MPRLKQKINPNALTYEQATMIRQRFATGKVTQTELAAEHGISQPAVSAIILNKTHRAPVMVMTKEEELEARRRSRFQKVYGISYEDWLAMLERANHSCEACGAHIDTQPLHHLTGKPNLNLDHDHITGKPRGVLCGNCNRGLGQLGDSLERLEGLVAYMKKYGAS